MGSCYSNPEAEDKPDKDVEIPGRVWRSDDDGDPDIDRRSSEFIEGQNEKFNHSKDEPLRIPKRNDQPGAEIEILSVENESSNGDEIAFFGDPFINGKSNDFIEEQHQRFNINSVDEASTILDY